jgi:DNA-binding Lrp family transcriptional regulator
MPVKLDQKDKIILYELDKNARQPLSTIAKKARMSREAVLYRIKGYQKEGLIRSFLTVVDMARLGFTHTKLYIKLHNMTDAEEQSFIAELVKNPFVSYVASCDGTYDLHLAVKSRSIVELNMIISHIRNKHWQHIKDEATATIISANHYYRDYLVGKRGATERRLFWGGSPEPFSLDPTNRAILHALTEDPRKNAAEIANNLDVSADMVLKRIHALEGNIITHYMLWPDVNKLTGNYYKVHLVLKNLNAEREKAFYAYCLDHPRIVYIVRVLAPWQVELDIETPDAQSLRHIIRELNNIFPDIIADTNILTVYDEQKFRFFDKACLTA